MKHIILLGLALSFPLYAEDAKPEGGDKAKEKPEATAMFKKKDTDNDGFLSKAEFTANAKDATKAEAAFTRLDKDADGKLSPAEFAEKGGKEGGKKGGKKGKAGAN